MGKVIKKSWNYEQVTQQAEQTITVLMKPAHVTTNSEFEKNQAVSRSFGAYMLWKELAAPCPEALNDDHRLFKLLVAEQQGRTVIGNTVPHLQSIAGAISSV